MSEPTLAELMAQASTDDVGAAPVATSASPAPARGVRESRTAVMPAMTTRQQQENPLLAISEQFGAGFLGVADTVSFSFLDEASALVESAAPTWMGGSGRSYAENLRRNRAQTDVVTDAYAGQYLAGQLAGSVVPVLGMGGRAKAVVDTARAGRAIGIGRLTAESAIQGALYGAGSSEAEDIFDYRRVRDAALGGLLGGGLGFGLGAVVIPAGRWGAEKAMAMFRAGKTPKLNFRFKVGERPAVADDVVEDLASSRKAHAQRTSTSAQVDNAVAAERPTNTLTGKADDVAEAGSTFTTRELVEGTDTARKSILDRIAKLTPQEAKLAASKLEKAASSGDLATDPHFRSILGLDLSAATDDVTDALRAAEMFEEMTQAILEKANMGKQSLAAQRMALRAKFGSAITEGDLDKLVASAKDNQGSANIGRTMMALAGVQFSKATKELLPEVLKGTQEARAALTEKLTSAIRISAKGRFLVSNAGRELGSLSHAEKLPFVSMTEDGKIGIEAAEAISARVDAALKQLDDSELSELLSRVGDLSDLEQLQRILLNPEDAAKVSGWMKARNTVGLWVKSNSLTPASGVVNVVGALMHDLFRNGWARDFAAYTARMAGKVDEATALAFQREVVKSVTWQAHGAGIRAGLNRLKWEAWTSAEKIMGAAGLTKATAYASSSRMALVAKGWTPPALREFDQMAGLAITDVRGFNEKLAARAEGGGAFATLLNAVERTYATTINTVDAVGTATARVVSGALDDYGRNYVMVREVYAQSAGHAVKEAIDAGLNEQQMIEYVSKRTAELAEMPPVDILEEVERKLVAGEELADTDKMLLRRDYDANREAEAVLFMDGPQTQGGRWAAQGATYADKVAGGFVLPGILMTYIRTPTRIFERGLTSYTPWAGKIAETKAIIARGGVEAAVEQARIDLGTTIMGIGMMAAATGAITITNGGWKNSANLTGAPANRLNLPGGGYIELSRLDPFALTIALGGIIGQAYKSFDDTEGPGGRDEAVTSALQTAFVAVRESVLEKSYLTGARDLLKTVFADDDASLVGTGEKLLGSYLSRMIPLAGTTRQIKETSRGTAAEAVGIMDQLFKVIPGMGGYLPARVDALGNEVEGRDMGFAVGTTADSDDLTKRIAAIGINITNLAKADPAGFDLTSEELSELRTIRAKEATNKDGVTMREALSELLDDPEFQGMERVAKKDAVIDVMSKFNGPARALFEERNQGYLADRSARRSFKDYIADGMSRHEAAQDARLDTEAEGLKPTRLP